MRHTEIDVSIDALEKQYNRATKLLDVVTNNGECRENITISPVSIDIIFMMLLSLVSGKAEKALLNYLGMDLIEAGQYAHAQLSRLSKIESTKLANSLWIKKNDKGSINTNTLNELKSVFGIQPFSFETSSKPINDWVSTNTNGKIQEILTDADVVDQNSIIINAVCFKSDWMSPFKSDIQRTFTTNAGEHKQLDFIYKTSNNIGYSSTERFEVVQVRYRDGSSFVAFLSKDKNDRTAPTWDEHTRFSSDYEVTLRIPKFKVESSISIDKILSKLGLYDITADGAISKLFTKHDETLGEIKHKTYLNLDEKGTEAAAVTAATMRFASLRIQDYKKVEVTLDRPFYYGIISPYSDMMFIGKYNG